MLPLIPGLLLLGVGGTGVAASYGMLGPQWATSEALSHSSSGSQSAGVDARVLCFSGMALLGEMISLATILGLAGEVLNRLTFRDQADPVDTWEADTAETSRSVKLDARGQAMQQTLAAVKPLSNFIYRTMQVGVLLIAAGTILGGVWADYSWGRFWGWDPKEVWALITLLVYLIPLHGRFAGWISNVRTGRGVGRLLPVGHHGLVRRQLRAGSGAAQLRLHRRGLAGDHDGDPLRGDVAPRGRRLAPVSRAAA